MEPAKSLGLASAGRSIGSGNSGPHLAKHPRATITWLVSQSIKREEGNKSALIRAEVRPDASEQLEQLSLLGLGEPLHRLGAELARLLT